MDKLHRMGSIIRERRNALGLTQKQLAEILSVTDKAVSKWERCESMPDISLVPFIAETLGVSIDYLMTGREQKHSADGKNIFAQRLTTKINTRIILCLCAVFILAIIGLGGQLIVFGRYFSLVTGYYRYLLYTVIISAVVAVCCIKTKADKQQLADAGHSYNGSGDKVFVLAIASACCLGITSYVTLFPVFRILPSEKLFALIFGGDADYKIRSVYLEPTVVFTIFIIFFAVAALNFYLSAGRKTMDKNVWYITGFAAAITTLTVMFRNIFGGYILAQNKIYYEFMFEREDGMALVRTSRMFAAVFAVILLALVLLAVFKLAPKNDRKLYLVLLLTAAAIGVYTAFNMVDTDYNGNLNMCASLNCGGIELLQYFTFICPHIVMAAKGMFAQQEKL